jgi:hypothetical protein
MKTLLVLAAGLLAGCTDGGPGYYGGGGYAPATTLEDVNQSIQDLKDQEQRNADDAEYRSEMQQMHDDLYR